MRRVPTWAMKMPKAWLMLASALNDQLGALCENKGILERHLIIEFRTGFSLRCTVGKRKTANDVQV